jgi:hypothetical protein
VSWPRRCFGVVVVSLVLCGFACGVAGAAQTRRLVGSFGVLSAPGGVAVDQSSGDVFVADTGNHRVVEFDAIGDFLMAFGGDVGGSGVDTCASLLTCHPGTAGSAPGEFTTPEFVAVDPTTGDVYVGDPGDGVVSKFSSAGVLEAGWGSGGQLNGSSTLAGSFGELGGIAVSSTGNLLVYNAADHFVFEFEPAGGLVRELELKLEAGSQPRGLGIDTAGNIFKANGAGSIEKFTSTGVDIGTIAKPGGTAFAVQPGGDVYVASGSGVLEHFVFNGSGEVVEPGGETCPPMPFNFSGCEPTDSVAVGFAGGGIGVSEATGDSYVSDPVEGTVVEYGPLVTIPDVSTGGASEVTGRSATVNGLVNPAEVQVSECVFEYGTSQAYGQTVACEEPDAAEVGAGNGEVAVHAKISGLTPGVVYHFRLVAGNVNGPNLGGDESFEALPPPGVGGGTVSGLTVGAARLAATVNPHGSQVTGCVFEYGTSTGYGTSVACTPSAAGIGAGSAPVAVSAALSGLSANVTYHWRVVAENASGVTTSADNTFLYSTTGEGLPDGRAYEMVTPPQKNGSLIADVTFIGGVPDVAADGSRVIASAIQCFASSESCNGSRGDAIGSPYEFTRTGGGWVSTPLAPAASEFSSNSPWAYNATTGTALFSMATPPFGEDDFYVRNPETGGFQDLGPNTPPEDGALGPKGGRVEAIPQAHTADFSHFAWESPVRWPFDPGSGYQAYEYAGLGSAVPLLVGVTGGDGPHGEGSHELVSDCVTKLGPANSDPAAGELSAGGGVVFFTAEVCSGGLGANSSVGVPVDGLYARVDGEGSDAYTVALSRSRGAGEECAAGVGAGERACRERTSPSECGVGGLAGEVSCRAAVAKPADAEFVGASADGSKAFFTSTQQLTDSASEDPGDDAVEPGCAATVGVNGCNLYEDDLDAPAGAGLVDVSAGDVSGGGPRVQGVMAISPDGTHVYFVAEGVLSLALNDREQFAQDNADNLYLFERVCAGGEAECASPLQRTVFITDMVGADRHEWNVAAGLPANVTSDGQFLVFTSAGDLTADDTSVSGAQQVFCYNAGTNVLFRVSVGNDGFNDDGNRTSPTPCAPTVCSDSALIVQAAGFSRSDPSMSDDGQFIFFQSPVALTPGALDDVPVSTGEDNSVVYAQNVYEWHAGHVYLVSDGRDVTSNNGGDPLCPKSSVCLLGSDVSGKNVFFTTADGLVGQDTDGELDIYDARVCEPESPCLRQSGGSSVECEGDACQGAVGVPPVVPAPASATFSGPGNSTPPAAPAPAKPAAKVLTRAQRLAAALKECRKRYPKSRKRRASCEASARHAYAAKKASKAGKASRARGKVSGAEKGAGVLVGGASVGGVR